MFLDIEMPDDTGFDVVNATKGQSYFVIFTMAYEQYAIKAFKARAIDYLLKPVDTDELIAAVNVVKEHMKADSISKILQPADVLTPHKQVPARLPVAISDGIKMLNIKEIIYLESDSNYTKIYLNTQEKAIISRALNFFWRTSPRKLILVHTRCIHR